MESVKNKDILGKWSFDSQLFKNKSNMNTHEFYQYDLIKLVDEIEQLSNSKIKMGIDTDNIFYKKVVNIVDCILDINIKGFWKIDKHEMTIIMNPIETSNKLNLIVIYYVKKVLNNLVIDEYYSKISELISSSDNFSCFLTYFTFIFVEYSNISNKEKKGCIENLLNFLKKRIAPQSFEDYGDNFYFLKYFFNKIKLFLG